MGRSFTDGSEDSSKAQSFPFATPKSWLRNLAAPEELVPDTRQKGTGRAPAAIAWTTGLGLGKIKARTMKGC